MIILNEDASRIVRIVRKQACYVRFAPADKSGVIPYILYANWRNTVSPENIERIELLNPQSPFTDIQNRGKKIKKFAVISRIPTPDNTYFPYRTTQLFSKASGTTSSSSSAWQRKRIFAIEFSILRIGEYPIPSIIDIVNSIHLAKGNVFSEWKNSETAKLFEDHSYKNIKQSSGYFF